MELIFYEVFAIFYNNGPKNAPPGSRIRYAGIPEGIALSLLACLCRYDLERGITPGSGLPRYPMYNR